MAMLSGVTVITDSRLVEIHWRRRSWVERLFSFPWNPFRRYSQVKTPSRQFYWFGGCLVVHPEAFKQLPFEVFAPKFIKEPDHD